MLDLRPITLRAATRYVKEVHRHHPPPQGALWALSAIRTDTGAVVGVAIVGRPVARALDDGRTLEITRLATDGTFNACSLLYAAVTKVARIMGYARVITYILASETGASLRALSGMGWREVAIARGGSKNRPSRSRADTHPTEQKIRWQCDLVSEVRDAGKTEA